MKGKVKAMSKLPFWKVSIIAVLAIAASTGAWAHDPPPPRHFSGLINDYTPETGVSGPWEMRGEWSLDLEGNSGKANFSAVLNMTHSDYWVVLNPAKVDDDSATGRHPHTHHITIEDAMVTPLAGGGFELSGPVYVTNDGGAAPFMKLCSPTNPCTLTVAITGGTIVPFSNITLTFAGPPTTHLGQQAIHGFVRETN